ncbi:GvpL/GvpF family gas vesicle protein [Streptomyces sp. NPDC020681]|uniref:GvpL/GvpF family gas vesicle protein n=1 Tax=Streptomyces sp. NPDC020681 TaxID=3365083 RepID=UPI00379FCB37
MTESLVTWLYAVALGAGQDPDSVTGTGMTGVAGEKVHVVEEAALIGIVGSVPAKDFGEQALSDHLQDLDWLEEAVRAHHVVICAVGRTRNVVPLRFATIYHDDDRVRALLTERRTDFVSALDRVAGRTEWGVKAYADERTSEHRNTSEERSDETDRPGTAYLLRRRAQRQGEETAHQEAEARAVQIHEALEEFAVESAHHRPQDPRLARYEGLMILNSSYLVPDIRTQAFAAAVETLRRRFPGVLIELVGPWPPYTFSGDDVTQERS